LESRRKNVAIHHQSYERKAIKSGSRQHPLGQNLIENGVVQGAVLSVTLFLVAIAEVTNSIEEPIKIIGYADDWMVHTTHQHQRVATIQIQKAMNIIIK
jgi:hypothetical protein